MLFPPSTLCRRVKALREEAKGKGKADMIYLDKFVRGRKDDGKSLTTEEDRAYIQELITLCDMRNEGMSRKEAIGVIQA